MKTITTLLFAALLGGSASAADAPTAAEIAARLSALQQNGSTYVRLQLSVKQASGPVKPKLDLQIKSRHTATATDVVYQVLWPKDRKGEAVLMRKQAGAAASGSLYTPPDKMSAALLLQPVFNSDLCYGDLVENSFAWEQQAIIGSEEVDGVTCTILESKPGKAAHSIYGSTKTWVDTRRMVPLRVEKYATSGTLVRRIDTTRVTTDDDGHHVVANLLARRPGQATTTELEGTKIRRGVVYAEHDFTTEGMKELTAPRAAAP